MSTQDENSEIKNIAEPSPSKTKSGERTAAEWLEKALAEEDSDNTQTALQAVNKALKLDPSLGEAWRLKASLLLDMDRHKESFETLNDAVQRLPNDAGCWFDLGAFLATHDNLGQAAQCYIRCHNLNPQFPRVNTNLGLAFMKLGDYPNANQALTDAIPEALNDRDKAFILGRLGEINLALNQFDKAYEYMDQSLTLDDSDFVTLSNMAMLHLQRQEPEPALQAIESAVAKAPKDAMLHLMHATILDANSKIEEGDKAMQQALDLAPQSPEVWIKASSRFFALSKSLEDKQAKDKAEKTAIEYLDKAVQTHPDQPALWLEAANCLHTIANETADEGKKRAREKQAEEHIQHAVSLAPDAPGLLIEATNAYLNIANAYPNQSEARQVYIDKALEMIDQATIKGEKDFRIWHSAACLWSQLKDKVDDALKAFDRSIELNPQFPGSWLSKAQLLHTLGKEQEAASCQRHGLLLSGELVVWGLFLIDEEDKPVENTQVAIETQVSVPQNTIAEQYVNKLKEGGHSVDDKGIVDGKYRIAMTRLPLDRIPGEDGTQNGAATKGDSDTALA